MIYSDYFCLLLLIRDIDIKTAVLYGTLEEEIFIKQPPELVEDGSKVCKLKMSLYGLKQSQVYVHNDKERKLILVIYVDDVLLF